MRKLIFSFTPFIAGAIAAGYEINIPNPVEAGARRLVAGRYQVDIQGGKAVFKKGKEVVGLPVKVEETARRQSSTQVNTSDGQLREIYIGETKVKLIFTPAPGAANAGGGSR